MISEVTTLYESNARQIPEMLRMSADNVERDKDVHSMVAVAMHSDGSITVYGWGDVLGNMQAIGILHTGITEIARIQLNIPVR